MGWVVCGVVVPSRARVPTAPLAGSSVTSASISPVVGSQTAQLYRTSDSQSAA
ncbi:hypothetical protein H7H37_22745, partial [Mycolicibacterium insubricum]|nr:hypothetical protein [Mycolicibacterium insubricum]